MQNKRLSHPFTIRFQEYSRINLRILGVLVLSAISYGSPAWAVYPYPKSSEISSVVWDFAGRVTTGQGSDLWPVTWGNDGVTYVAWGDGGGPNGTDSMCRTNFGLAKLTGSPPNFGFTTIWGCKSDGSGCATEATHDTACNAPYGGTIATSGVPDAIIAIENTLYSLIWNSRDGERLIFSTDYGHSWTDPNVTFPMTNGYFAPKSFVQHGKGDAGGSATYLYILGEKFNKTNAMYMARAPKVSITDTATWEYFTGTADSPSWGAWAGATPVFYDAGTTYPGGKIQYFPVIARYIYTETRNEIQQLGVYEAVNPWGPWNTIYMSDSWGNYGITRGLWYSIVPSSISADDMSFYMTFSGSATPVNWDSYNLIKGTFVLQPTTTTGIPMAPASLAIR